MKHKSSSAFTLTELLVLVPVAALLGSMLLAVSNDANQQLKAAACLNNMRRWGLGFMLYANDYNDYFPYDGYFNSPPCAPGNTNAWFNLIPRYIGQKRLCDLYTAGTPPRPLTKSVWSCPSATNITINPVSATPYFMYSMSACWHTEGNTSAGLRRNRATSPPNTILFCEEPEDQYPETNGQYDTVTRHFGGSNFVFADGHADWIAFTNFCRQGNAGCPAPLGNIAWDNSEGFPALGDWSPVVHYHWWPFVDANATEN
jgi:prepilin-type processing-associated H-X9-DG protein